MNSLDQSVASLPGIGPRRSAQLEKLGLLTLGDFLTHFPRRYEDRSRFTTIFSAVAGDRVCVRATIAGPPVTSPIRKGLSLTKVKAFDETGMMSITFFNNPYIKSKLVQGQEYVFYGAIEAMGRQKSMVNPILEPPGQHSLTGRIMPIYPLAHGLSQKIMQDGVQHALSAASGHWEEPLPPQIIAQYGLCDPELAYQSIHFPDSLEAMHEARRRLIFEELFIYGCASRMLKGQDLAVPGLPLAPVALEPFFRALPFAPTGAQTRAIDDISGDMTSGQRMNRLLQGDVGSGKTLVAAAGAYLAVKNGAQAAIMAPTELLASQHFDTLSALFEPFGFRCALLTASHTAVQKRAIKQAAAAGEIDLLCGTHALLQDDVAFKTPGLIVVDEQHRFGVRQRALLRQKAPHAHLLVMSATPIPRTLTLIIYGDLSVSILDELPPGRKSVQTFSDGEAHRGRILRFLAKQVDQGGQAYIVCPSIEESGEQSDRHSVESYAKRLSASLPQLRIGVMHGKLKAREKESIMAAFAGGQLDVLVSTTVIEVGVNVPNASLMIVENADLFGLSQLHQLRGRVGRGSRQAYCILMSQDSGEVARQRLKTLCQTNDGFAIAEQDLLLRGPGDFLGNRQHGMPEFKLADLAANVGQLQQAISAATETLQQDPQLARHPLLRQRVADVLRQSKSDGLN